MCRLYGVLSSHSANAAYYALEAPQSLLIQSHIDRKRPQGDGWGIGWFEAGRPRVIKSPRPLYRDQAQLRQAVKQSKGHVSLGHVRWASNPLKLPRHKLIGKAHSQPFTQGSWLFVHNGTLYIPREVRAELGSWSRYIRGNNDSEVLFYWLLKTVIHGTQKGRWGPAIKESIRRLDRIWQRCKGQYPLYKYPYHGLNWILTNGKILMAFCYVDPRGWDRARALGDRHQPYYQLQYQRTEQTLAVSSEPLTRETNWEPLAHGHILMARFQGQRISVKTMRVM